MSLRNRLLGQGTDDTVYQVQMHEDFHPYRVDVTFEDCREVDMHSLLRELRFIDDEDATVVPGGAKQKRMWIRNDF